MIFRAYIQVVTALMLLISIDTIGANIYSVKDGDWEDPTTWSTGTLPQDGDNVFIEAGDTVNISTEVRFHDYPMIITVAGTLNMVNGKLHLPSFSTFQVVNDGNYIWTVQGQGCDDNLKIGATILWKGCWGHITSPATFDDPLPVELISFNAVATEGGVEVSWSTASELNSDYFIVEKSTNGTDWEQVEIVSGNGTSSELSTYSVVDLDNISGNAYYRLVQVDFDGTSTEYDLVSVTGNAVNATLLTNPVESELQLINSSAFQQWLVINLSGSVISNGSLTGNTIPVESLTSGVYILQLTGASDIQSIRFVKQ